VGIVQNIAENVPNLKSLYLRSHHSRYHITTAHEQQRLVKAVGMLRHLKTLVLNTHMQALYTPNEGSPDATNSLELDPKWVEESLSPAQCRYVTFAFASLSPSLCQLSFPYKGDEYLTYLRSADGQMRFDGFYVLDTTSWWM